MLEENINNFMVQALEMANLAFKNDEVPVGAVIVKDGEIIGRGSNKVIKSYSVASHAEINAINDASQNIKNYRLNGCDLYVTLEPCHMCAKAIVDARIKTLYFGATEPKTGAVQSIDTFFDSHHLNHKVRYRGGYIENESASLLKNFFRLKRN
jgi:tRNA(adenine34) deaminase